MCQQHYRHDSIWAYFWLRKADISCSTIALKKVFVNPETKNTDYCVVFKYDYFETSIIDYRPTSDTNELGELVVSQCS